jgi:lysophospholipase L1-like esterase
MKLIIRTSTWFCCIAFLTAQLPAQQQIERAENVRGPVTMISATKIAIEDGTSAALTDQTRYRKVNDDAVLFEDVQRSDVTPGMWAVISPNKLPDGSLVARMVFVASSKDKMTAAWAKRHELAAASQEAATSQPSATPAAVGPQDPTVGVPRRAGATTQSVAQAQTFMDLHQQYLARAKEGNVDVLFLGDSITRGWATRGKDVWAQRYGSMHAANFGVGGDHTQHVIWRIENGELNGIHPKVVVLLIGTNNSDTDSPESIASAVTKIIHIIQSKSPETKVLLLAVFPRNRPNEEVRVETINHLNPLLAKLDDGKMVRYLDIGPKFLGADGTVPLEIMPDGLHPDDKGYQIWADAMQPLLDEMLK